MLVTGLLSLIKSPTTTHTPEKSTEPQAPTSDSSQQTRHAENLPEVLTGHIDCFLGPVGASDFSQTNRNIRQGSALHFFRQRLKPEFRVDGKNFIKDFGDPAKRLDQYVPVDPAGKKYLAELGISGVLTAQKIKNGRLTIQQAQLAMARIDAELSEYDWDPLEIELLNNTIVRDCVVADRVDVNFYLGSEPDSLERLLNAISTYNDRALINLASPVVQKYLYSYDLTLHDALTMPKDHLTYLERPEVQAEFESQQYMTLEVFLA